MTPSQIDIKLGELIIKYCQAENDGDHALGEQLLFEIKSLREQQNDLRSDS